MRDVLDIREDEQKHTIPPLSALRTGGLTKGRTKEGVLVFSEMQRTRDSESSSGWQKMYRIVGDTTLTLTFQ